MDAQVYPKDFDIVLQVYKWVIDQKDDKTFRNYREDGSFEQLSPKEYGEQKGLFTDDVYIRLMKKQGNSLVRQKDYQLSNAKDVEIAISDDGKNFALLRKAKKIL